MSKTVIVIFADGYKKPYEGVPDEVLNSPDHGESKILGRAKKDYPDKTIKTWGVEGKEQRPPTAGKPAPSKQEPAKPPVKQEPAKPQPAEKPPVKQEPAKVEPSKPTVPPKPDSDINDIVAQKEKEAAAKAEAEKKKQEPVKQEPVKQEPVKQEPVKVEPQKQEPVKQEPAKVEPQKQEPVKQEPAKVEPEKQPDNKPVKPAQAEPGPTTPPAAQSNTDKPATQPSGNSEKPAQGQDLNSLKSDIEKKLGELERSPDPRVREQAKRIRDKLNQEGGGDMKTRDDGSKPSTTPGNSPANKPQGEIAGTSDKPNSNSSNSTNGQTPGTDGKQPQTGDKGPGKPGSNGTGTGPTGAGGAWVKIDNGRMMWSDPNGRNPDGSWRRSPDPTHSEFNGYTFRHGDIVVDPNHTVPAGGKGDDKYSPVDAEALRKMNRNKDEEIRRLKIKAGIQ